MKGMSVMALFLLALPACSQFHVPPYSTNHKNVIELRKLRDQGNVSLTVGAVTGVNQAEPVLLCRAVGPIKAPSGMTFGEYIKEALVAEMSMAEVYVANSDVNVSLDFDSFDFDSASGSWILAADVTVKQDTFPVKVFHDFSPSWFGETACDQTAQALMPATQEFIYRLVSDEGFQSALGL